MRQDAVVQPGLNKLHSYRQRRDWEDPLQRVSYRPIRYLTSRLFDGLMD